MKALLTIVAAVHLLLLACCDDSNPWPDADGDADGDADADADEDEPSIGGGDVPVDVIPRALFDPPVDGRLGEWPPLRYRLDDETTVLRFGPVQHPTAEDAQLLFDLRWTDQALYFAGSMRDDEAIEDSELVWQDDSVELYVDGDNNEEAWFYMENDHQYTVVRDGRFGHCGEVVDAASRGVVVAVRTDGPRYAVEIAVPWSELTGAPAVGRVLGIDVAFNDDDDGDIEDSHLVMWLAHPMGDNGSPVQDTTLFQDLTLGE